MKCLIQTVGFFKKNIITKVFTLLIFTFIFSLSTYSQLHNIGDKTITLIDSDRNNRPIETHFYYPATTNGQNTNFANGSFPLLVFGHGFVMSYTSYQWLIDSLVPRGYILAFAATEGGFSPSHQNFALDLKFINSFLKQENNNFNSFFYQKLNNESAIMGHSMGGGSAFLASEFNTEITCMISFAAANTNPSSINAAANINVPILMFIGENDGVTPPLSHQIPMYNSYAGPCKTRITILGGGHCFFANPNTFCSIGEASTSPQPTISREQQIYQTFYLLLPYLDFMLKNDIGAGSIFLDRLNYNTKISFERDCNNAKIDDSSNKNLNFKIFPNPSNQKISVSISNIELPVFLCIYDFSGKELIKTQMKHNCETINIENLNPGNYIVKVFNENFQLSEVIIKN